jgi:hypothetical protein
MQKVVEKYTNPAIGPEKVVEKYSGPALAPGTNLNGCWTSFISLQTPSQSIDPLNSSGNVHCACEPIISQSMTPSGPVEKSTPTSWVLVGGKNYKNFSPWGQGKDVYGCG